MTFKSFFAILCCTLFLFSACKKDDLIVPRGSEFINPLVTEQDKVIHDIFNQYKQRINTVGLTIGVLKDDSTSFYGYGEVKLGTGRIPEPNTFFEIGSITKVFTSIAAVDFLNSRNLTIDEPIKPFLPADLPRLAKDGQEITFRNLMTHTSGLPYMPDNMGLKLITNIDKAWEQYDTSKLYKCLKEVKLESKPSTVWNYSNLALGTLGTILQRNIHQPYEQIILEKITQPLGLTDTKKTLSAAEWQRMAKGYHGSKEIDYWDDLNAMDGAGVLRSTTADLLKFAQANIAIPELPIADAIRTCQQAAFVGKKKDDSEEISMNLGWVNLKLDNINANALFHNGGTGGFSTNLFIFKEQKIALVVFFNSIPHSKEAEEARGNFMQELVETILP